MFLRRVLSARNLQAARYSFNNYCKVTTPDSRESIRRSGDGGFTKTVNGEVLGKDNELFHAIGATEELLSFIGVTREHAIESEHDYIHKLQRVQTVLIDINTAISHHGDKARKKIPNSYTLELEEWIEKYNKELPPVELYIIPGGGLPSASIHMARSLCRRAERYVVPLVQDGGLDVEVLIYLNRLSDFLLTLSRIAAKFDKRTESIYVPQSNEKYQGQ